MIRLIGSVLVSVSLSSFALAQRTSTPTYQAIVYLADGGRVRGTPDEVINGSLTFVLSDPLYFRGTRLNSYIVPLDQVQRVVIRRIDKRRSIRAGALIGTALGGYLAYQSSQKSAFRSPVMGGLSIALSAATLGASGAFLGSVLGGATRQQIRPPDTDDRVLSLERQLRPFTRAYAEDPPFREQ
ncbi:hypothetical protein F5984_08045 [Rudanella paleaurantiibacter]|uniref:Glycine zipper family protein n=1 Tax=Rudanella paleaurantiibacter TaxID=2614655 RepID=A0A7J5U382_9BACT|nr:hypothetical protein [Rudanella paleaurantiibacter]KAB7732151.1 hypothetical protein F5984_08045 [Rudanella paleaurantiibacter]